jgi:hypothetical protein
VSYPKEIKALDEVWRIIYSLKDPMEFIDMLAFNSYLAGGRDRQIPVSETRTVFLTWLRKREAKQSSKGELDAN